MINVCVGDEIVIVDTSKIKYTNNYITNHLNFNDEAYIEDNNIYVDDDYVAPQIFIKYILPILYNEEVDVKSITYDNISYIQSALKFMLLEPLLAKNIDIYYRNINKKVLYYLNKGSDIFDFTILRYEYKDYGKCIFLKPNMSEIEKESFYKKIEISDKDIIVPNNTHWTSENFHNVSALNDNAQIIYIIYNLRYLKKNIVVMSLDHIRVGNNHKYCNFDELKEKEIVKKINAYVQELDQDNILYKNILLFNDRYICKNKYNDETTYLAEFTVKCLVHYD